MKQKNRLLDYDMVIYQDDEWFKFSLDSVLLSNFVTLNLSCRKIMDLASGNAPIPMLLSNRTNAHIDAIEYQECIYDLGIQSILENKLDSRINLVCGDVRNISKYFSGDCYDTVLCNPPYFNTCDDGFFNENRVKMLARHEVTLELEDVIKSAYYLLKSGGNFAMVHRTERFISIIDMMKKYHIEPKRVQFLYSKEGKNSELFLIEGTKNGKSGLKVLSPVVLHNDDGSYTDYVRGMFSNESYGEL
jgi:tRNA1(Val) A37 N6-methylase TrmN6